MAFSDLIQDAEIGKQVRLQEQAKALAAPQIERANAEAAYMADLLRQGMAYQVAGQPTYAKNDELEYAQDMYRSNYDSRNIPIQTPTQIPAGATTNGARLQPDPDVPTGSAVADYLARKEAWRQAQSKGK